MSVIAGFIVWLFGLVQVGIVSLVVWLVNLGMVQLFHAERLTMESLMVILFFVYIPAIIGRQSLNDYLSRDK